MKKITVFMCSLMLVLSLAGAASAVPTTWTDTMNTFQVFNTTQDTVTISGLSNLLGGYTYTHDITDDVGGVEGFDGYFMFDGGNDIITGGVLQVSLRDDDKGWEFQDEIAFVDQMGLADNIDELTDGDLSGNYNFSYTNETYEVSLAGLISLNLTGMLNVTIWSLGGDFLLDSSTLLAYGDNEFSMPNAPVPEPATLLLLGTGLLGVVGANRKRFGKKK